MYIIIASTKQINRSVFCVGMQRSTNIEDENF